MYRYNSQKYHDGFATLLLVMVVSFSFLVGITTIGHEIHQTQNRSLARQQFQTAQTLTSACITEILVRILRSSDYSGRESIVLYGGTCAVGEVLVDTINNTASFDVAVNVGGYVYREFVTRETYQ
ncbi:MAG: hypothetical protein RLZZ360_848 [Candidatus Parcubacteria bacterium]|jgi:hypothetical protein